MNRTWQSAVLALRAFTRRGASTGLLIILLATLILTPGSAAGAPVPPSAPKLVALTVGIVDITTLDPANAPNAEDLAVSHQIFDTLTQLQPGGTTVLPGLADSWTVSADGLTWTFTLHPGVKFSDGSDLNAAAVVANINRWWDAANPAHIGTFDYFKMAFGGFKNDPNAPDPNNTNTSQIVSVSAPAADQVVLTLKYVEGDLPTLLAEPFFGIASPAAFGTFDTHPVGSGPLVFQSWTAGTAVVLTANPAYWAGPVSTARLTFKLYSDPTLLLAGLNAGQIQAIPDLPPDLSAASFDSAVYHPETRASGTIGYLGITNTKTELSDVLVRQAIAFAIDKDGLIANYYKSTDAVASQFLPENYSGYLSDQAGYGYNPVLAKDLLAQAGYPDGFAVKLSYRNVYRPYMYNPGGVAAAIKTNLEAIGLTVTLDPLPSSELVNKAYAGQLELYLLGWTADYPTAANFFGGVFCNGFTPFGTVDTTLCDTVEAGRATTDLAARQLLFEQAEQNVVYTVPMVPLAHTHDFVLLRNSYSGVNAGVNQTFDRYDQIFHAGPWGSIFAPITQR